MEHAEKTETGFACLVSQPSCFAGIGANTAKEIGQRQESPKTVLTQLHERCDPGIGIRPHSWRSAAGFGNSGSLNLGRYSGSWDINLAGVDLPAARLCVGSGQG